MSEFNEKLRKDLENDKDYVIDLRRYFHMHPELSAQEENTAKKIEEELHKIGVDTYRVAETGVVGEISGNNPQGKTIVLRADIDALPMSEQHECAYKSQNEGIMHACGHDAHTAALLGAARVLAANRDLFDGKVILSFQSGEEIGYGARKMVEAGVLKGADRTFGIHAASNVESGKVVVMAGPNNASVDQFKITVHGKAAHISTPEFGVNAAYIASQIVIGIQSLVTIRTNPMENLLIGVGKVAAGTSYNIIAEEAVIEGTVRAFSHEVRAQVQKDLKTLAENTAAIYGGSVTYWNRDNTSVLINDEQSSLEAQQTARKIYGADNVITSRKPALGGDDFAEYIIQVPGVYAYVGTADANQPCTQVAHHDVHFDIDEKALLNASSLYAGYAVDFLNGDFD
jgi:amidohydrolase